MHSPHRVLFLAGVLVSFASAQADWHTTMAVPKARAVHAAAFDVARSEIVLFGGNTNSGVQGDTWLWSAGAGWRNARPQHAPTARREHAMANDLLRGRVVLFGGWDGAHLADTWLWDGTDWTLAAPASSPGARMPELAFDPAAGRVLMFGGQDGNGVRLNETWSWDGSTWTQVLPATVPPARFDHGMATDWARSQIVLFGGWDGAFLADTWVWNGTDWTAFAVAGPTARSEHRMAFAGGTVILFGGQSSAGRQQDSWQWDGAAWTQLGPTVAPDVREEHVLVDDVVAGNAVLFGGWHSATGHLGDHWTFAGGQWTAATPPQPIGAGTAAMDYDPVAARSLLFGGYQDQQVSNQTWSYAGGSWTRLLPATSPPARAEPGLAFDRARNEFVMYGGVADTTYHGDTWRFAGGTWQQAVVASPPARWGHAMVYDEARGAVLLHGGRQGGTAVYYSDTWQWNGAQWQQLAPAAAPAGRVDHGIVFDRGRGAPVLFGGWIGGSGFTSETWAFTAGNWVLQATAHAPSPRSEHMMAYDRARDCVVVFGGEDATGRVADTWELTGDWTQRTPVRSPEPREEGVMVFDEQAGEIVLAVGWDLGHFTDTWHFAARPAATAVAYGAGCQGSAPAQPVLAATRPWLGGSVTVTVSALPNGAPVILAFGVGRANLPLGAYGMPGCTALLQPVATLFLPNPGTVATTSFALPAQPSFAGIQYQMQAYAAAPGANPVGVIDTNGVELTTALP